MLLESFTVRLSTKASEKTLKVFDSLLDVSYNGYETVVSEKWSPYVCDSERRVFRRR